MTEKIEKNIQAALHAVCVSITHENGYDTDFNPANIHQVYNQRLADSKHDAEYPRAFVLLQGGETEELIAERLGLTLTYNIIFVCHAQEVDSVGTDPHSQCLDFIADFRRALYRHNPSLGGLVHTATVNGYITDSGALYPEGTVEVFVKCSLQAGFSEI